MYALTRLLDSLVLAGYYGYMWSECFSADIFEVFRSQAHAHAQNTGSHAASSLPPSSSSSSGSLAEVGQRYRRLVLAPGATEDAETLLRGFLGRAPSQDAFLRSLGLQS